MKLQIGHGHGSPVLAGGKVVAEFGQGHAFRISCALGGAACCRRFEDQADLEQVFQKRTLVVERGVPAQDVRIEHVPFGCGPDMGSNLGF